MSEVLLFAKDEKLVSGIRDYLGMHDADVTAEADASALGAHLAESAYDLLIIRQTGDIKDTVMLVTECRSKSDAPIMLILDDDTEAELIKLFNAGADDCVTAPVRMGEFTARALSHIAQYRRLTTYRVDSDVIKMSGIELDRIRRRVKVRGRICKLTNKEYELLKFLMMHAENMIDGKTLYREIWGDDYAGSKATVVVHIRKLREKIEENPAHPVLIETTWGAGYCFHRTEGAE